MEILPSDKIFNVQNHTYYSDASISDDKSVILTSHLLYGTQEDILKSINSLRFDNFLFEDSYFK